VDSDALAEGLVHGPAQGGIQMGFTAEDKGKAVHGIITIVQDHLEVVQDPCGKVLCFINGKEQDTVAVLRSKELYGDHGVELVFECAGSAFTAQQAVQIVARGGKIMMVGTQSKPVPIDFLKINREVTIQTSFRYCNNFPQTIEAIATGKFNVKDMVTHIYDYKDVQQAFSDAIDPVKKAEMIKGVVKVAADC
jgi:threonine dehydrogenase-like Zn-dependent dehydrogenase